MVSGHLQEKRGIYHCVLSYKDMFGNRKTKWISTGLPVKGNKKRAEAFLAEVKRTFEAPKPAEKYGISKHMLYVDFLDKVYMPATKNNVELSTYSSYEYMVKNIKEYFKPKAIRLCDIQAVDIQDFYTNLSKKVSASTVRHYHSVIHASLKMAYELDLIPSNPSDKTKKPGAKQFIPSYYSAEEMNKLFEATKDDDIGLLIRMTAFYGLRKSEVLGLKWSAINFSGDTITINHTVTRTLVDGKNVIVKKDRTKRKASHRTLPLDKNIKEELLKLKAKQKEQKKLCKSSYSKEYEEYIFVDSLGNLFNPNYVSNHFKTLLKRYGLKQVRFHDLRHSAASLLLAAGIPMKQIQEWLGHSDYSTTANIYAHLESESKKEAANAMSKILA